MTKHSLSAVVAASLLSSGLPATSASAADLGVGGSCCADLEERVAELEATPTLKGNRKVNLFESATPPPAGRTDKPGRLMAVASAALMLFVAAAATGQAQAQNYDGDARLRFGAFLQGSQTDFDVERSGAPLGTASMDGFGGGASFGYDWGKSLILGVESDVAVEDTSERLQRRSFATDYLVTLRGRIGANLQPGWLVYATGGAAFLGVEFQGLPTVFGRTKESDTLTGWTVGGGTEIDLAGVTLFAEYLFADFDTFKATDPNENVSTVPARFVPARYSADVEEQLFRAGVKFKIGHDFFDDGLRKGLK
jgi:opacity protein-like surface antigen